MITTFDLQWSKQTSIPTILLHGIDDFNSLVDYACRQCGYHCHTVNNFIPKLDKFSIVRIV